MLSPHIAHPPVPSPEISESEPQAEEEFALAPRLEALERQLVERALRKTGGNQSRAARLLKVSRNGLAKRIKRLGLTPEN